MPNIFQRAWNRLTRRGQVFPPAAPPTPAPEPQPERRGFLGRLRDRVTGAGRRREQEARELAERQAQQERQAELERREREVAERQREVERQARELAELRDRLAAKEERTMPKALASIPPVMPLGPKGREGAAYTTMDSDEVMARLQEAASLGKRVSLRVHDEKGWHDLFLNERSGPGRHKPARGISADYLAQFIGGDLEGWVSEGCDLGEGETSDYEAVGEVDGYQLTVWS